MGAMSVYLSGPMTGLDDYNRPAFHEAARRWREAGWLVYSPAEEPPGYTEALRPQFLRRDVMTILLVDAIAVLPGWERSKGSCLEVHLAEALELPILDAVTMEPYRFKQAELVSHASP